MIEVKEESRCLASLAVFRELYNSNRDIYCIIGEFIKEIIYYKGKYQFTITELTQLINDTYDFSLIDAVVSSSLNRFSDAFTKSQGIYTITNRDAFQVTGQLTGIHNQIHINNDAIISDLVAFIEDKLKEKLSDAEKEKVIQSFCSFIIDESTSQTYSEFVSAFIVKSKGNSEYIQKINTIKEGVVLYTGLKYNTNLNELGSWTTELTIYIETEILFHLAGYNGEIYQTLFNDFISLVNEINSNNQKKKGKRLIRLKYFSEVKDEIERFFKKAEYIVSGRDKANPSKTAMTTILDGCSTPADIIEKKAVFYDLLRMHSIMEDDYQYYYSETNYSFNIEDQNLINEISAKTNIEDVSSYLKYLNFINIHRRGISDRGFENVGYILLSGTSNTILIAWDDLIKTNGNVPLASNLSFLTNKLWFRLNKGFGEGVYPKTFDVVTKAQMVLSTQVNNSVAEKFEELQDKFKKGKLTEEQAVATIAELRKQAKKPEDIDENDIQDVLSSIEESSIEKFLKEQDLLKSKSAKFEHENHVLKVRLGELEEEKRKSEEENRLVEEQKKQKRIRVKKNTKWIAVSLFLITIGIVLYIYCNILLGILTSTIAGIITILSFLGLDYKVIKNKICR
ncbi:hypothetical protein SDC9_65193 [bioreactor metagenome]|uniref:Uncharacterized protein n=1 Tax=bioreactor metagenome TaxID=1076179 RepID=A0A644XS99_9ZZZZ|nr:hypothetical protein [Bacteroides graminisolvens]